MPCEKVLILTGSAQKNLTLMQSLQAKQAQVAERKKRKEENELKSLVVQKVSGAFSN